MLLTGDILIGASRSAGNGASLKAIDPATGETLEPAFAVAGATEVDRACALAAEAFDAYRETSLDARAAFLETIAANILDIGDGLVDRACAETGLPRARIEGERMRTVGQLKLFASVVRAGLWLDLRVDTALPERKPLPRPDLRQRHIALGPVAVFGASNFPLAFSVAGGDTASALAAGCPVVVKGHPAHPGTGELVGEAIRKAVETCGLPEGTFSLLLGANETGSALVKDARIKAVGFTGSRAGGLALAAIAAARAEPIPVYAEMSSINPVYLLPGALAARAEKLGRRLCRVSDHGGRAVLHQSRPRPGDCWPGPRPVRRGRLGGPHGLRAPAHADTRHPPGLRGGPQELVRDQRCRQRGRRQGRRGRQPRSRRALRGGGLPPSSRTNG